MMTCLPRFIALLPRPIRLACGAVAVMWIAAAAAGTTLASSAPEAPAWDEEVTQGALRIVDGDGKVVECPLTHTAVKADVSGFLARVNVTQTFVNPLDKPIEATYVFPLPHQAAVDRMTMVIGNRRLTGKIKRRAEARQIYEEALAQGQTAALLEQERPNIFTQSVGNLPAGEKVQIEISYVDALRYDMGVYEFQFPMVVGPRYNPGSTISNPPVVPDKLRGKVAPPPADTSRVPDASKINPPVLKPGYRTGHDISLQVHVSAGVPLRDMEISNHETTIVQTSPTSASVQLDEHDSVPNKDFLMRFTVVGEQPEVALLNHTGRYSADADRLGKGYFMLMVQPHAKDRLSEMPPREIVFLVDVSGSMRGEKTAKVIDAMRSMLSQCRPVDTIQVVTFASSANKLFDKPLPVVESSVRRALDFSSQLKGSGGTRMLQGVKMAIDEPIDPDRLRIVVMLTDGFIGNESEIISHVGKKCGDQIRFWAIGIGSSPNMFLIDGVARQGGGLGKQLAPKDNTEALTEEIMTRIQRAQLAGVSIDWGDLDVRETYPATIPELWAGRPIIVFGRYADARDKAQITVRGKVEGQPVAWNVAVDFTQPQAQHDVLARIWARRKIEDLMQQTYYAGSPAVEEEVTAIALDYSLMTQYTSFVAIDEKSAATPVVPPVRMAVPVPLPEGAVWEGFFGEQPRDEEDSLAVGRKPANYRKSVDYFSAQPQAHGRFAGSPFGLTSQREQQGKNLAFMAGGAAVGGRANVSFRTRNRVSYSRLSRRGGVVPSAGRAVRAKGFAAPAPHDGLLEVAPPPRSESNDRRTKLLQSLSQELQAQLQSDQLAVAQATLTAIRVLQHFVVNGLQGNSEKVPSPVELHRRELQVWRTRQPALDQSVDLVLRDLPVPVALSKVAKAADISINLVEGAADDVLALLNQSDPLKVEFFDAKGKTVWQTLDEVLYPLKLEWYVDEHREVVVTTARRRAGRSIWVYDLSALAWPLKSEFDALTDKSQASQFGIAERERLLQVVKQQLRPAESDSIDWLSMGYLGVYGDMQLHADMARLIKALSREDAARDPAFEELAVVTRKRWQSRQQEIEQIRQQADRERALQIHDQASWALLADATIGRVDWRAFTELQSVWTDPRSEIPREDPANRLRLIRSYWALQRAAQSLPHEFELQRLAEKVAASLDESLHQIVAEAIASPDDQGLVLSAVFSCLARTDPASLRRLAQASRSHDHVAAKLVQALANADPASLEQMSLEQILRNRIDEITTDELVLLTALASQRAGGATWQAFRANAAELLGRRPVPGELVVLINRLDLQTTTLASGS